MAELPRHRFSNLFDRSSCFFQLIFWSSSVKLVEPWKKATSTRSYGNLNRLTSIASGPMEYVYKYNAVNQRTRVDWTDGSLWSFHYVDLGRVTSANLSLSDDIQAEGHHVRLT